MTAMPGKNPYRPGVGTPPLHLAGRDAELRRFRSSLRAAPEISANIRLTGLRGVGKTVLLHEFARVADENSWLPVELEMEPRHNREATLVAALGAALQRARERVSALTRVRSQIGKVLERGQLSVNYEDVTVTFASGRPGQEVDLAKQLFDTTKLCVERGYRGVVLLLDEAQAIRDEKGREGEHPLSMLIAAVTALQKQEIPLGLVLCGLPTLIKHLLEARTYTERMFRGEEIGSLEKDDARDAFVRPLDGTMVDVSEPLVDRVLRTVEGYPYFLQLWGAELWDAAEHVGVLTFTVDLLDGIEPEIYRRLDRDFYDPRLETLTPAEQDVLLTSARCPYPPLRVSDLHKHSDKTQGNVNVLLGRLIEAGVLYRRRKGEYEYTAPQFRDYLQRRLERA